MTSVSKLLHRHGPCLSSKLAELLITDRGISPENARKLISRAVQSGEISSIKNMFPKREHFVYLKESYGSERFWIVITDELVKSGSSIGLALTALTARGGIIPVNHFGAASGSPLAMKKKLSFTEVLGKLINLGLCEKTDLTGIGECLVIKERDKKRYEHVARQVNARLVTESVFISTIVQWAQNLNLVSYDSVKTRLNDTPSISNYQFDITAPSYLSPLLTISAEAKKPGFFACDVLLGTTVSLVQVQPFIAKCKSILSLKNVGRTLFIFAASQFEPQAFSELKRHGIIPATPSNLFGEEVAKSLKELNDFLDYYFIKDSRGIEKIDSIMTCLAQVKGAAAQLQGALFEYLVAEVVREDGGDIEIGRLCKSQNGKYADSDVCIRKRHKEIRFIECKGYKPYSEVKHEDVKNWVSKQIPVFRDQGKVDYPNAEIIVEIWTTGKFSEESSLLLEKCIQDNNIRKRCEIRVLEAHEVRQEFYKTKNKNLINVYEKHFANTYYEEKEKDYFRRPSRLAGGPDEYFN
ncbi:hypothetical protein LZU96_23450 (plasmid) [Pantoea agglomerans]|uniref:hypothetical protein n=1 Tax=Enterobacter agglomerans TaxID=549 RepID=UPI001F2E3F1A|nr:hypothetical protein [Pantoea agglomerans]UIL55116.1 hypothetical protein LZU96_23450 [Pantoea agglomerans]